MNYTVHWKLRQVQNALGNKRKYKNSNGRFVGTVIKHTADSPFVTVG